MIWYLDSDALCKSAHWPQRKDNRLKKGSSSLMQTHRFSNKRGTLSVGCHTAYVEKALCIHICIHTYVFICTHICMHLHMYIYMYIHVHVYTYIYICTHVYIYRSYYTCTSCTHTGISREHKYSSGCVVCIPVSLECTANKEASHYTHPPASKSP